MLHPRSERRYENEGFSHWRPIQDLGSRPMPTYVRLPEVLYRRDGPPNPTLVLWKLREV